MLGEVGLEGMCLGGGAIGHGNERRPLPGQRQDGQHAVAGAGPEGQALVDALHKGDIPAWNALPKDSAGFTKDPISFSVVRFIAGLGIGGVLPVIVAQMVEYSPKKIRSLMTALMTSGYALGGILAAVLGKQLIGEYGWQAVFIAAGVPVLLVPFILKLVPESMTYLIAQRRNGELAEVARHLQPGGKHPADAQFFVPAADRMAGAPVTRLFQDGRGLSTALFWVAFFSGLFMVYALSSWLTKLMAMAGYSLGSALSFVIALNVGAIIGAVCGGWLADRLGRTGLAVAQDRDHARGRQVAHREHLVAEQRVHERALAGVVLAGDDEQEELVHLVDELGEAVELAIYKEGDANAVEARSRETHDRTLREAESFLGNANNLIQPAVGVLVVKHRQRIRPRLKAREFHVLAGRGPRRSRPVPPVRKAGDGTSSGRRGSRNRTPSGGGTRLRPPRCHGRWRGERDFASRRNPPG